MRKAKPGSDFDVTVEGVGAFVYGRRTLGDATRIRYRYLELMGDSTDEYLSIMCGAIATHEVLCVSAPEGWGDLSAVDMMDGTAEGKVFELCRVLGEKEDSFRDQANSQRASQGSGNSADSAVLVPA